jgi:CarboxypepD_reg-like domain
VTVQVLGTNRNAVTQPTGYFLLLNLQVGQYTLRFSAPGFVTQDRVVNVTQGANPAIFVSMPKQGP